jgi:hypothetical protein
MLPCYTIVRVANDGRTRLSWREEPGHHGDPADGYERLFRAEPEPPREVYLMAERWSPASRCPPHPVRGGQRRQPVFPLSYGRRAGQRNGIQVLGLRRLDALEALQRALTPLLIEPTGNVLPGDTPSGP